MSVQPMSIETQESLRPRLDNLTIEDSTNFQVQENLDNDNLTNAKTGGGKRKFEDKFTNCTDNENGTDRKNNYGTAEFAAVPKNDTCAIDDRKNSVSHGTAKRPRYIKRIPGIPLVLKINILSRTEESIVFEQKCRASGCLVTRVFKCTICSRVLINVDSYFHHRALHKIPKVQKLDELNKQRLDLYWEKTDTGFR